MTLLINGDTPCMDSPQADEPISEFFWDGCHKFYLINSPEDRERMLAGHWTEDDIHPAQELPDLWDRSCALRFISSADLEETFVSQDDSFEATVEWVDA
ncbi:hypothetical protein SEA_SCOOBYDOOBYDOO_22 [Mycobacterium phage ScoobyDoobyDoo]|nr:hypothetical protein SEA_SCOOBYDOOBYDOO_22 [Mycobacterium phage ScoobyDoobyDoo]